MNIPIITTTGTKGKTTTVYIIADVLRRLGHNTVKVDTTGHYVNGEQKSTLDESKATWGLVPTVSPGRYLWEFLAHPDLQDNGVAVLEAALGSSRLPGMGYRVHNVGVFLNVFEDHLGTTARLKTKSDIAIAKEFVFDRLARDGVAVLNADDELVVRSLRKIPKDIDTTLLPFGMTFEQFDVNKHLEAGGEAITLQDTDVILRTKDGTRRLFNVAAIPWTFNGTFGPSLWNLMAAAAAVYAFKGEWSDDMARAFEAVRLDPYGGRLTVFKAQNGATLIADYAHEKVSLTEVSKLGRSLLKNDGKLIGVVRLAHDRTDDMMRETGELVGTLYDSCVVYEKIDGYLRKPKVVRTTNFPEIAGRTSQVFADGIRSTNPTVERILREDQALARAAELAGPDDVVVIIVNDDIKRSIGFIREAFKAEFV